MDVGSIYGIITLIILLIFSAIFSGSEVALFSLDEKKLSELKNNSHLIGKYISTLLQYPRRLLVTILIGNTIFNVAASIISVTLALRLAEVYGYEKDIALIVQILLLTIIVIIFAEITPKVWANKHPIKFSKIIAIPLYVTYLVISPISKILTNTIHFFISKIKIDKTKTALSTDEIAELADIGIEKGTIEEDEHELLRGLETFGTMLVREVMTPRVDMISVPSSIKLDELLELINKTGKSRIPVYKDDLDNILGILYAKDMLPYLNNKNDGKRFSIKSVMRENNFVPETKLISKQMQEFQEMKTHISIVVDEYGGTAGIITLEDILEEIVGEIRDEHDKDENEFVKLEGNKYQVLGKLSMDELEELFEFSIEEADEDYDTIGGYILNHTGTIPEIGFTFEEYGLKFTVLDVSENRINIVEVEKLND
ncbi:MAG: hemolysin family protein [Melioribacteraceae bacterium]